MAQYTVNISATSNTSTNTADTFIELDAPANVTFKVKRVRVGYSDGTATSGLDHYYAVKLYRWETATAAATAITPIPRNGNAPAAVTVGKGKTTTTALALGTTNVTLIDLISINARALYEWLARDDDDMIVIRPGFMFGVVIASSVASIKYTVTVDFVE